MKHVHTFWAAVLTKKHYTVVLVICVLLFGFFLRRHNYTVTPRHGATFDEFAWTWLGINLYKEGILKSWSSQPQYTNREHITYQGAAFFLVEPYLEHPALFGLVAGFGAMISGSEDMYDVTLYTMRRLSLVIGVASIALVFFLVRQIYDTKSAILASAIYTVTPTVVIGSRLMQNENFLIPTWLLALVCLKMYFQSDRKIWLIVTAILSGLITLAKVPWFVVCISLVGICLYRKKWRDAIVISGVTIVIFSIYPIYGLMTDSSLFINLLQLQTARYDIHFGGLYSMFTNPLLVDWRYVDGWVYFGWFALFVLSKDIKKHYYILIPVLSYLAMYLFAIPDEPSHGWYRYPFLPFLTIATSIFLIEEFKRPTIRVLLYILIVGMALFSNSWENAFGFSYAVYRGFILITGLFAAAIAMQIYKRLHTYTLALYTAVFFGLSIWSVTLFSG